MFKLIRNRDRQTERGRKTTRETKSSIREREEETNGQTERYRMGMRDRREEIVERVTESEIGREKERERNRKIDE